MWGHMMGMGDPAQLGITQYTAAQVQAGPAVNQKTYALPRSICLQVLAGVVYVIWVAKTAAWSYFQYQADDKDSYAVIPAPYHWLWTLAVDIWFILVTVMLVIQPLSIRRNGANFEVRRCCGTSLLPASSLHVALTIQRYNVCVHNQFLKMFRLCAIWSGQPVNGRPAVVLCFYNGCSAFRFSLRTDEEHLEFCQDNGLVAAAAPPQQHIPMVVSASTHVPVAAAVYPTPHDVESGKK